jgi:hypothetical protein
MNQDPTSSDILDSTSNGFDFDVESSGSMTSDDLLESKIGKAISFDGSDDYIYLPLSENFNGPTDKMTFEFWLMLPNGWSPALSNFLASTANAQEDPYLWFYDEFDFHIETDSGGDTLSSTQTTFTAGNWYHFSCVWETDTIQRIYIGGSLDGEAATPHGGTHFAWDTFSIGAEDDNVDGPGGDSSHKELNVTIGEFRLSSTVRSADWISTEYNNQDDPNNFYTIGEKESSPDYWAYNSYKYRKQITIDATKVSADLTDFPVLIDLNDTDLHDSAKVQTDGDDIVFTTASGVKLDHEIELFDQTGNGTHAHLVAWVRIPSLSATEDTDLLMYYGNGAAESQENPEGVWSSDYLQVFHLDETSGNHSDIVSNSDTGIVHGSIIQDTLGMVGGSDDFQGLITESWIEISNSQQLISNSPFTVGACTQHGLVSFRKDEKAIKIGMVYGWMAQITLLLVGTGRVQKVVMCTVILSLLANGITLLPHMMELIEIYILMVLLMLVQVQDGMKLTL